MISIFINNKYQENNGCRRKYKEKNREEGNKIARKDEKRKMADKSITMEEEKGTTKNNMEDYSYKCQRCQHRKCSRSKALQVWHRKTAAAVKPDGDNDNEE